MQKGQNVQSYEYQSLSQMIWLFKMNKDSVKLWHSGEAPLMVLRNIMKGFRRFCIFFCKFWRTDRQTNQPTDQQTNRQT